MKTKLLAFLLCLVMLGSVCLLTACGVGGNSSDTTTDATTEAPATEAPASYPEVASLLKGVDAVRKSGMTFTGSFTVPAEDVDYSMNGDYLAGKFRVLTEDKCLDEGEYDKYETVFDGAGFYWLNEWGDERYSDDDFDAVIVGDMLDYALDDKMVTVFTALFSPSSLFSLDKVDYTKVFDKLVSRIDLDDVAELIGPLVSKISPSQNADLTYTASFTSDAFFAAVEADLKDAKAIGEKTVEALFDSVVGNGAFAQIKTVLNQYNGTDKVSDLIPAVESALAESGIQANDVYDLVAEYIPAEITGEQIRALLTEKLADWTIDDAISYALAMAMDSEFPTDAEGSGATLNYAAVLGMIDQYAGAKLNELIKTATGYNAVEMIDTAITVLNVCKKVCRFQLTFDFDREFVPTKMNQTFSIYADEIPDQFFTWFSDNYRRAEEEVSNLRKVLRDYNYWQEQYWYYVYGYISEEDFDGEAYENACLAYWNFDDEAYDNALRTYNLYREFEGWVHTLKKWKDAVDPSDDSPSLALTVTGEVKPSATVVPSDTMKERIAEGVEKKPRKTYETAVPETTAPATEAPAPATYMDAQATTESIETWDSFGFDPLD